jgi:hypothetical protein
MVKTFAAWWYFQPEMDRQSQIGKHTQYKHKVIRSISVQPSYDRELVFGLAHYEMSREVLYISHKMATYLYRPSTRIAGFRIVYSRDTEAMRTRTFH